ncbi:MAG: hypothetical protein MI974_12635 [Chitinophagales bacterium]|nr:hypothetical protein [Chitinophagales bacterium]
MKKRTTAFITFLFIVFIASAQSVVINSPTDLIAYYTFEAADFGAGLSSDIWTGDAAFIDDDSGADATQGCGTAINDLTGKVALIDRGSCEFAQKCLNAENAGAIAAIVLNDQPGAPIAMGNGAFGSMVTIPCVMLSFEDGQIIRTALENETVNITIGAFTFENDLSISISDVLVAPVGSYPISQLPQAGDFVFSPGAVVNNIGANEAENITLEATITHTSTDGNTTEIYHESISDTTPLLPDSVSNLLSLPAFDAFNTGIGAYTIDYEVSSMVEDELPADNTYSLDFNITENIYSKAPIDKNTGRPATDIHRTIAGGGEVTFLSIFDFPHGQGITIENITCDVVINAPSLADISIEGYIFEWIDDDDDGNMANDEIELVGISLHTFPSDYGDDQAELVMPVLDVSTFEETGVVIPNNDVSYIVGVRYNGPETVFFGFNDSYDYSQYHNLLEGNNAFTDHAYGYLLVTEWGEFAPDFENGISFFANLLGVAVSTGITLTPVELENNLSIEASDVVVPPAGSYPISQLLQADNFVITPGVIANNLGINEAENLTVEAVITRISSDGSTNEVYHEVVSDTTTLLPDSTSTLLPLPAFDVFNAGIGDYILDYKVSSSVYDDAPVNNTYSLDFNITRNIYSKAPIDKNTGRPATETYRAIEGNLETALFSIFNFPNGSGINIDSVTCDVRTDAPSLSDVFVEGLIYEWIDTNGDGNVNNEEVMIVGLSLYVFPSDYNDNEAELTMPIMNLFTLEETGIEIQNNDANYILALRYNGPETVFFGFNDSYDYGQYQNLLTENGTFTDHAYGYQIVTDGTDADFDFENSTTFFSDLPNAAISAGFILSTIPLATNLSLNATNVVVPPIGSYPASQLTEMGDFVITPGAMANNLGIIEVEGFTAEAVITHTADGGSPVEVYNESAANAAIIPPNSISALLSLPPFDAFSTGIGAYTIDYSVDNEEEDHPWNNSYSINFNITENIFSKAAINPTTERPNTTTFRTIEGGGDVEFLSIINIPYGQDFVLENITCDVASNTVSLADITIDAHVYEWIDTNEDGNLQNEEITLVGSSTYTFPTDYGAATSELTLPITDLLTQEETGITVSNNDANFIIGVRYFGAEEISFGFDESHDYQLYQNLLMEDGTFTSHTYGHLLVTNWADLLPDFENGTSLLDGLSGAAVSTGVTLTPLVSIKKLVSKDVFELSLFPSPASESITAKVNFKQDTDFAEYRITNANGELVYITRDNNVLDKEQASFNVKMFSAGQYFMTVRTERGAQTVPFVVQH